MNFDIDWFDIKKGSILWLYILYDMLDKNKLINVLSNFYKLIVILIGKWLIVIGLVD